MNYREYKKDGTKVSLLGFGGMRFPQTDGKIDREASQKLIDRAFEAGVNYYDTAYMYHGGESEVFFGQAMAKYPRDSFMLADKMPMWMAEKPEDVDRIFNDQLSRCKTDYFDFYLLHSVNDDVYSKFKQFGAYEVLDGYRKSGKVRRLGFSFHGSIELLECILNDGYEWDFVQIQLNYFDWSYQNAEKQYEIITSHGLQCIIMEPVRGGSLVSVTDKADEMLRSLRPDRSIPSWAMRFAASLDGVLTVLSGMSDFNALEDNIASLSDENLFEESDREAVFKAAKMLIEAKTVPCTGCKYCDECPQGIAIPELFSMFNNARLNGDNDGMRRRYGALEESQKPANCIACGVCSARCPQAIDVPEKLKAVEQYAISLEK